MNSLPPPASLRTLRLVLALLLPGAGPPGLTAQSPPPDPLPSARGSIGPVKLRDDSIDQVLALLGRWTGRTILRPQALPGATYTLTLEEPVETEDAILALETLLNMQGIALAPLGDRFLKVAPINQVRTESPEFIDGSVLGRPPSGRVATKLFELRFLRASEFLPHLAAILNPNIGAAPVIFEKNNAALVTDSISNLQRVEQLLARLDRPAIEHHEPRFYQLQSAQASEVAGKLRTLLSGPIQASLGTATTFQADDRTNQIILISDPRQMEFFDRLIGRLDVKADPNTRNEIIFLRNAAAAEVATLLSQLVAGRHQAAGEAGARAVPAAPVAPGGATGPPAAPPVPSYNVEAAHEFSPLLTILPEERSNAIVVSGTADDIRLVRELVGQIDVLLAQVRIEVVIAEVTLGDEATSGINALGLRIEGDKLVGFAADAPGLVIADGAVDRPGGGDPLDLAAEIAIVTTPRRNDTHILSVPTIITTHNKEGSIFVGEQRPVISSYLNDAAVAPGPGGTIGTGYRSTVASKDIGIELTVKPLIGGDGSVQLEVSQEVNDILGEIIIDGNPQPRIGRRTTKSFVSVRSGDIIVLGGLQRDSRSRSTSRLGPIPLLGDLFGARRREDTRTDLVFFLRPTVLTNTPADHARDLRRLESGPHRERIKPLLPGSDGSSGPP